jgi:hypothetical protein
MYARICITKEEFIERWGKECYDMLQEKSVSE